MPRHTSLLTVLSGICVSVITCLGFAQDPMPKESQDKIELAKIEAEITSKEGELVILRSKAKAIKKKLDGQLATVSFQKLIAALPKSSFPTQKFDGEIERIRANKWLKENIVGKTVELTEKLAVVLIDSNDGKEFGAMICIGEVIPDAPRASSHPICCSITKFKCDTDEWLVLIPPMTIGGLSEKQATELRDTKGKNVNIKAKIVSADFEHGSLKPGFLELKPYLYIQLDGDKVLSVGPINK
jgi:hypothetical protein